MLIFETPIATKYTVEGHIDYHQQIINYIQDYGNVLLANYPELAAAGDPDLGTVKLEEGVDYYKRYENNIAPNPNAKVTVIGIGHYTGKNEATFEIRIQ
ncbi:MAG: hypothetical protein LBB85_01725 [Dysgonamonadaceae bacterium]|jgi:hypothetical protein|nr:hypothetical protein [Dysgonamonadaceae bacterium]